MARYSKLFSFFFLMFILPVTAQTEEITDFLEKQTTNNQQQTNIEQSADSLNNDETPTSETQTAHPPPETPPLSGTILTPTAYKSKGINEIGPSLDINLAYYIGRLYGKNTYDWTTEEKNYLDRIGLWILGLDGKLVVQTETKFMPAMAVGVQGAFILRDSSDPELDSDTKVNIDKSDQIGSVFVVLSKKAAKKIILSAGYSEGTYGNFFPHLSEFLTPEAIELDGKTGDAQSNAMFFGGFIFLLKQNYPISVEILIPQGAVQKPKLVNLRFGKFIKMNFQLSYLFYEGGWDLLGCFQYRFNLFPR